MNFNFLKKIFKFEQYSQDYREFLRKNFLNTGLFPEEYHSDNTKKIQVMNEAIMKAAELNCLKGLDQFKRLPWSYQIL